MRRKLLASLLALCLVVGLLPATALATEVDYSSEISIQSAKERYGQSDNKLFWYGGNDSDVDAVYAYLEVNSDSESSVSYILVLEGTGATKDYAFDWNKPAFPWSEYTHNITAISVGKQITRFGSYTLTYADTQITELDFSGCDSLVEIGNLYDCGSLQRVIFPSSFTKLESMNSCVNLKYADFSRCINLKDTGVDSDAFAYCKSLETIDLSGTDFKRLPNTIFYACTNLKTVIWPKNLETLSYLSLGGVETCPSPAFEDGIFFIPDGIKTIEGDTFNTSRLTHIILPQTVETLKEQAFTTILNGLSILYAPNSTVFGLFAAGTNYSVDRTAVANLNGGTFSEDTTTFEAGKLAIPEKECHIFGGWYDNEECAGDAVTTPKAGTTYYAKWIELKSEDISMEYGSTQAVPTIEGVTLSSWQSSDSSIVSVEGDQLKANKVGSTTLTADATTEVGGTGTLTVDVEVPPLPSGGGSGSSNTTTKTVTNADGSVTTTVTNKTTGTVTETTKYKDGSTLVVETKKDGTVTTTETRADGVRVKTVDAPEKAVTVSVTIPESVGTTAILGRTEVNYGTVAVDAESGEVVKLSVPTEGGLLVKLDGSAELTLVDNAREFSDTNGHWAENAIDFATAHEMFAGTSETTFSPDDTMTRAMLMTVLARFDGEDTAGGSLWYEKGMAWAVANGVSDGSDPEASISREQLAAMLWRYAGSPVVEDGIDSFNDAGKVSGYAADAMRWAVSEGLIVGVEHDVLAPQSTATRAQVATILMRFVEMLTK